MSYCLVAGFRGRLAASDLRLSGSATGTGDGRWTESPPDDDVVPDIMDTVVINVGGVRHEVFRDTLRTIPDTKLARLDSLQHHYRKDRQEYFFDRHPGIFQAVLNYYRTGELHMPQDVCGPSFKHELDFWELDEVQIQECCWIKFNVDKAARNTLELLGKAYREQNDEHLLGPGVGGCCCPQWYQFRAVLFRFLDNPLSSKGAKAYAVISFALALFSIAIFCAETHPSLKVEMTAEHYAEYYGVHVNDLHEDWYESSVNTHSTVATPQDSSQKAAENTTEFSRHDHLSVPHPILVTIDNVLMVIFTVDLLLRFFVSPRKCMFFREWLNIVDALSISPFYIELIVETFYVQETYQHNFIDALFTLKVLRIFRIMRLLRHYKGLQVLALTLKYSYKELILLAVFLFLCTIVFASLIYFTNHNETTFQSIPHSFWWAIITMTTVGYGDVVPTTNSGYFVGSLCALSGVLVIAFTVPTLVNNFLMFYSHVQYRKPDSKPDSPKAVQVSPLKCQCTDNSEVIRIEDTNQNNTKKTTL